MFGPARAHQVPIMEIANNFGGRGGRRLADLQVDPDHLEALRRIDLEVILRDGPATGEFVGISADSMALAVAARSVVR